MSRSCSDIRLDILIQLYHRNQNWSYKFCTPPRMLMYTYCWMNSTLTHLLPQTRFQMKLPQPAFHTAQYIFSFLYPPFVLNKKPSYFDGREVKKIIVYDDPASLRAKPCCITDGPPTQSGQIIIGAIAPPLCGYNATILH